MREIIDVEVKVSKADLSRCRSDLLAIGHFSDARGLDRLCRELDEKLDGAIKKMVELGDFKGKDKTSAIVYSDGRISAKRLLLVGLGERRKATLDTVRRAAALAANTAVKMKLNNVGLALHSALAGRFDLTTVGRVCAEGAYFGSYRYDEFVTESEDERADSLSVELVEADAAKVRMLNKKY